MFYSEESLSDEELLNLQDTPQGTLERGSALNPPGSSGRKQKAAIKALRQAEQKRYFIHILTVNQTILKIFLNRFS